MAILVEVLGWLSIVAIIAVILGWILSRRNMINEVIDEQDDWWLKHRKPGAVPEVPRKDQR